jgi:hypothetical protein
MREIKMQTRFGVVYVDGSFKARSGKVFTKSEMKTMISDYRGMNRINKPMALLFYTDVMNGKTASWRYAEYKF